MSDLVTIALISATPPTLTALLAWWSQARKQEKTHQLINSRMDQLLNVTGIAKMAEGVAQGRAESDAEKRASDQK